MAITQEADEHLIGQARSGDAAAFEALIERYRSRVFRLAVRFTRNPDDAQEVLQEVFFTVYQKLGQFEGKSAFSTWLYRVAVNTALMRLRGRDKAELVSISEFPDDSLPGETEGKGPEDKIMTEQALARIERAMIPLPADFKTVLILRDIEDFSNEETAEIMGLSVAAVKSRLHRARGFMRKKLEDLYKETTQP
ncbi:MAG TPA: sigma-70 family RNA polymerase sigma factor [bacterium]|nr:sigma-70 family RNA polymerase sigma factor [bacterium]